MEGNPSKRRKVEYEDDPVARDPCFNDKGRKRAGSLAERREKSPIPKLVLPAHHAFGVHGASRQKPQHVHESQLSSEAAPQKIQQRQLVGTQVSNSVQAAPESASTVLAIAIDNGQGIVSETEVPMASKSVWIPGYGELTMASDGHMPTITATSLPGAVTPPPAVAASQARNQALQTQEAIAKQLNVVPEAPSNAPGEPTNTAQTPSVSASVPSQPTPTPIQSPSAVSTPESRSQQVLSSPTTPVPTTPQTSAGSSAGSSSSYFSSSPASTSNSSPPHTSNPSTISQLPSLNNPQLTASSNSTLSATTLSSTNIATSSSISSVTSEGSATASSLSTASAASQASLSSSQSLAALASATRSLSGFSTSTLTSSSGLSSTSNIPTLTSSSASSSTFLSTSASISSQSLASSASGSSAFETSSSTSGGAGGAGGASNTATGASPTSTSGGGSGGSSTPPTSVLAGGIVGGVAGATLLALILLLLFRWRRSRMRQQRTISPPIPQTLGPGGVPQPGNMTQRSSTAPIATAGLFGRLRPASAQTATTADTVPSERGFQKISGRKLPSVLTAGGDGYGDNAAAGPSNAGAAAGGAVGGAAAGAVAAGTTAGPSTASPASKARGVAPGQGPFAGVAPALRPGSPQHSLSGSSFYRDSHGFYGGVVPESTTQETDESSSPSTSPIYPAPLNVAGRSPQGRGGPSNRQPEVAITRPGPARTPVINEPGVIRTPSRANQPPSRSARGTPPPPQNPFRDALGRSHPSQDGSRGSRFREDTTPP